MIAKLVLLVWAALLVFWFVFFAIRMLADDRKEARRRLNTSITNPGHRRQETYRYHLARWRRK